MSGLIDTNLLVYAVHQESSFYVKAKDFLETKLNSHERLYLCWSNLYEFLRVVTHPKIFPRPLSWKQGLGFLNTILDTSQAEILREGDGHMAILQEILTRLPHARGNIMHDCHVAALLKENGVSLIYTHDTDFRLFEFLEIVDPL